MNENERRRTRVELREGKKRVETCETSNARFDDAEEASNTPPASERDELRASSACKVVYTVSMIVYLWWRMKETGRLRKRQPFRQSHRVVVARARDVVSKKIILRCVRVFVRRFVFLAAPSRPLVQAVQSSIDPPSPPIFHEFRV